MMLRSKITISSLNKNKIPRDINNKIANNQSIQSNRVFRMPVSITISHLDNIQANNMQKSNKED